MGFNSENVIKVISDHYSYSTHVVYESVRNKCKNIDVNTDEIKKYDIIIKQKDFIKRTKTMRRQSEGGLRNSIDFAKEIFIDHDIDSGICSKLFFHKNTSKRRCIDFINLLNLLYIAVSIPLLISFDIKMEWYLIFVEAFSLFLSLMFIIINIRTPVHLRGGTTLNLRVVITYYYHNGLLLDLIAL
jgi:membrane-associated HD superfamily phosphohydrolase